MTTQPISRSMDTSGMVGESDVVGKIKFTKTQVRFLEDQEHCGVSYERANLGG